MSAVFKMRWKKKSYKSEDKLPLMPSEENNSPDESSESGVRIVLVGKTGAGKSALGNTILGKENFFKKEASPSAITRKCASGSTHVGGRKITVVDTPGLFGSSGNQNIKKQTNECDQDITVEKQMNKCGQDIKVEEQIKDCVRMSLPGPHAFLLVIKVGRFTEEEKNAVEWICENFGEDASLYTIILITHTDQLQGKDLDVYVRESRHLLRFIDRYGGRYFGFNNAAPDNDQVNQVEELLKMIDEMVKRNGGKYYTNKMFQKAQAEMIQKAEEERRAEEKRKRKGKGKKIKEGLLGAATAVGVGGVVAGGVLLGVTSLVVPVVGVAVGGIIAVGAVAKLAYDKHKSRKRAKLLKKQNN